MNRTSETDVQEFDNFEALVRQAHFVTKHPEYEKTILSLAVSSSQDTRRNLARYLLDYDTEILLYTVRTDSGGVALTRLRQMTQAHLQYQAIIAAYDRYCEAANNWMANMWGK